MPNKIAEFVKERDAVFLDMDEESIRAFCRKWNGVEMPTDVGLFWAAVHKARTGAATLPIEARRESKQWLLDRNLSSHDDGDI